MKKILALSVFTFIIGLANAQVAFRTGNAQLDTDLNNINANASLHFGAFRTDLSIGYDVSEKKIDYMHSRLEMKPGEIYVALEISKISRRPVDEVIRYYESDKDRGWGYIAKQCGIKPGSAEFHQLKNGAQSQKGKSNKGHKAKGNNGNKGKGKKK
ncbi:hypothetical protein [Reichenbachiella ulvae]|uniref:Uncharacterized protein n=1 Tax=Reichenbachiella ulvae TaxID=2980104 RepID=A0ABT3CR73_9BACT|nr:hypothetical protein [Reichenbachiella ulvae]MCV9386122.1 hypothetical protein [Reichenbachiella ulvae]